MFEAAGLTRHLCRTSLGVVHYVRAGPPAAPVVVLLHQTPRSIDEYAEVLPRLATTHAVIAIDTPGYGCSDRPVEQPTIADYAASVLAVLDDAGCDRAWVGGHHTGGVIAVELAASRPERVAGVVFSGPVYVDEAMRPALSAHFRQWHVASDGSHLIEKWRKMLDWTQQPALAQRVTLDLFRAGETSEFGHFAVGAYRMEDRLGLLRCPGLLIYGRRDPFTSRSQVAPLAAAFTRVAHVDLDGGIFLPNEAPDAWAEAVRSFAG